MLSTIAKLKSHLGIPASVTSKDALLTVILEGVSDFIETYCRRKFGIQDYTIKLSGNDRDALILPQYPIDEVTSITIDGSEIDVDDAEELDVDYEKGILYRESGWDAGRRNIEIEYAAGYILPEDEESGLSSTLPKAIELAAIRMAAKIYERRTAEGVGSVSTASFTANYNKELDDDIKATLQAYIQPYA